MKIEHVAFMMADPLAAADWYTKHLGFKVVRGLQEPPYAQFMMAPGDGVLLEIYNNPLAEVPDYASQNPLLLHLAFDVDDVQATRDRLVAAGATVVDFYTQTPNGDELVMLRDPWGVAVQLVKRTSPMV